MESKMRDERMYRDPVQQSIRMDLPIIVQKNRLPLKMIMDECILIDDRGFLPKHLCSHVVMVSQSLLCS